MEEKSHNELLAIRRQKLDALRASGIDPFGSGFETTGAPGEIRAAFAEGHELAVAGAERILRKEINAQVHADLLANLKQELK